MSFYGYETVSSSQIHQLQNRIAELERRERQRQNGNGLTPDNHWDILRCHPKIWLDQLMVKKEGEICGGGEQDWRTVLAKQPIPRRGIFYFEVKILCTGDFNRCRIAIGLATEQMPLNEMVGTYNGTYAYGTGLFDCANFWGHAGNRRFMAGDLPSFSAGDVVGCGVNLDTRQIIYTKNGQRLDTSGLFVRTVCNLFPCVSLPFRHAEIVAYFGPNFKYNLANELAYDYDSD
ncbi:hypothetical protein niasHT_031611 [Heterodera trifolii]|uniref:B30.2/SPRY domain-containing protein n=1 Tax=Heterodera trifolii TaxID=157864 RepID=A0ABD2IZH1_9BILA